MEKTQLILTGIIETIFYESWNEKIESMELTSSLSRIKIFFLNFSLFIEDKIFH